MSVGKLDVERHIDTLGLSPRDIHLGSSLGGEKNSIILESHQPDWIVCLIGYFPKRCSPSSAAGPSPFARSYSCSHVPVV